MYSLQRDRQRLKSYSIDHIQIVFQNEWLKHLVQYFDFTNRWHLNNTLETHYYTVIITLRWGKIKRHCEEDIFKLFFFVRISLYFNAIVNDICSQGPINDTSALFTIQIMARRGANRVIDQCMVIPMDIVWNWIPALICRMEIKYTHMVFRVTSHRRAVWNTHTLLIYVNTTVHKVRTAEPKRLYPKEDVLLVIYCVATRALHTRTTTLTARS